MPTSPISSTGVICDKTIAAAGNVTINKQAGRVQFAGGSGNVVVTNNLVTANSIILVTCQTINSTTFVYWVTPAAGSFTIFADQAGNQVFNFLVIVP